MQDFNTVVLNIVKQAEGEVNRNCLEVYAGTCNKFENKADRMQQEFNPAARVKIS